MASAAGSLIGHRRQAFGETRTADKRFGRTIADQSFAAEDEAHLAAITTRVTKATLPAHGIQARRGLNRPLVVLTMPATGRPGGYRVLSSVTEAERVLGAKTCSICEAIRDRRPVRGHVVKYLDLICEQGETDGDVYFPADRGRLSLSKREQAVVVAIAN